MLSALSDGIGRVNRAPAILAGVWILAALGSLPRGAAKLYGLAERLGSSLAAATAARGVNYTWMQEFSGRAAGLAATFSPTIIGFGASLDNISAFIDNTRRPVAIVGAA